MKKVVSVLVILIISLSIFAEDIENDIFQVEYKPKSAQKAMLFSAVIPGVGQFYANPKTITAFIFPIIEFGLWYGYIYFQNEGDDITKQYKEYANERYDREHQHSIEAYLVEDGSVPSNKSFYDGHFRLDHENTQHFYEDIGKYDKYIFGWDDWYDIYTYLYLEGGEPDGEKPNFEFNDNGILENVIVADTESDYYVGNESLYDNSRGEYSAMRAEYISMRQDAEEQYDQKRYCGFGLIINHVLATIDAVRVTRKYNIEHITQRKLDLQFSPRYTEGNITPSLMLSYKF